MAIWPAVWPLPYSFVWVDEAAAFVLCPLRFVTALDFTPAAVDALADAEPFAWIFACPGGVPCGFPANATPVRAAAPHSVARPTPKLRFSIFIGISLARVFASERERGLAIQSYL